MKVSLTLNTCDYLIITCIEMLVIYFRLVCGPSLGLGTMVLALVHGTCYSTATQFLHCTRNQTTQHRSDKWLICKYGMENVVDADRSNCPIYLIFNMQFMHKIWIISFRTPSDCDYHSVRLSFCLSMQRYCTVVVEVEVQVMIFYLR